MNAAGVAARRATAPRNHPAVFAALLRAQIKRLGAEVDHRTGLGQEIRSQHSAPGFAVRTRLARIDVDILDGGIVHPLGRPGTDAHDDRLPGAITIDLCTLRTGHFSVDRALFHVGLAREGLVDSEIADRADDHRAFYPPKRRADGIAIRLLIELHGQRHVVRAQQARAQAGYLRRVWTHQDALAGIVQDHAVHADPADAQHAHVGFWFRRLEDRHRYVRHGGVADREAIQDALFAAERADLAGCLDAERALIAQVPDADLGGDAMDHLHVQRGAGVHHHLVGVTVQLHVEDRARGVADRRVGKGRRRDGGRTRTRRAERIGRHGTRSKCEPEQRGAQRRVERRDSGYPG